VYLSEGTGAGRTIKRFGESSTLVTSHLVGQGTGSRLLDEGLLAARRGRSPEGAQAKTCITAAAVIVAGKNY